MTATPIKLEENGKFAACACTLRSDIQLFSNSALFENFPLGKMLGRTPTIQLITQRLSICSSLYV